VSRGGSCAGSWPQKLATIARLPIEKRERSDINKVIGYHKKVTLRLIEDFDPQIRKIIADFSEPSAARPEEV
jgi:hypothetical protein